MSFQFTGYQQQSVRFQTDLEAPLSDVLGATAREALTELPISSAIRGVRLTQAERSQERIDANTARQRIKDAGLEGRLTVDDNGIAAPALDILIDRKRKEVQRQEVLARSPSGVGAGVAKLGTSIAVGLLDPINIGLSFVPVVGEARYLRYLKAAKGAVGRAGVRLGVGAVEGAAGAAIAEPLIYAVKTQEQADYDFKDSLLNVAFGTVFGGGLHVVAGGIGDAAKAMRARKAPLDAIEPVATREGVPDAGSVVARVDALPLEQRESTLRTAVGQAMEGREVSVDSLIPSEERFLLSETDRLLDEHEARLVQTAQGPEGLAVAVRNDASQTVEELTRATVERDAIAAEVSRLPEGSPQRGELLERQQRAQQLVESRQQSVDRLNRVRAAETDLEQLRYMRSSARTLDDLVEALPTDQQRGLKQRIAQGRREGFVRSSGQIPERTSLTAPDMPAARIASERQATPEAVVVADVPAARAADEQLAKSSPAADPIAEQEQLIVDQLADLQDVARIAGLDLKEELAEIDKVIVDAETYGKAARAAALCGLGH